MRSTFCAVLGAFLCGCSSGQGPRSTEALPNGPLDVSTSGAVGADGQRGTGGAIGTGRGVAAGGTAADAGGSPAIGGVAGATQLGDVRYLQIFNPLQPAALWKNNLDGTKIKAHPENAQITAGCGTADSACLRVVYRHTDGIHKQPPPTPLFTTTGGVIDWTPSDAGHTGTATDVIQANLPIDGTVDGTGKDSNAPIPAKAYTLTYDFYFEPGFDFAKGGKLPGLAAKAFDSGCTEDGNKKRNVKNWSVRVMWRNNGRLQLYSYDQTRPSGGCGVMQMMDAVEGDAPYEEPGKPPVDDKFRFQTGKWYTLRLSVQVNDNDSVVYKKDAAGKLVLDDIGAPVPISGNGEVSLAVQAADGSATRLLVSRDVALRDECNGPCPVVVPDSQDAWVNVSGCAANLRGIDPGRVRRAVRITTLTSDFSEPDVGAANTVRHSLRQPEGCAGLYGRATLRWGFALATIWRSPSPAVRRQHTARERLSLNCLRTHRAVKQ